MSKPLYEENPVNMFASNYSILEKLDWLRNRSLHPTRRYEHLTEYLPQKHVLNPITPALKLAFIGDVMPIGHRALQLTEALKGFLSDADFYIVNLEGIIFPRERWLALSHKSDIIASLLKYFPPQKTLITCANNHTGDFGYKNFERSYQMLKDAGYHVIGRLDEAHFTLNNQVHFACATRWSNQVCEYVPRLKDVQPDPQAAFNFLIYHWGYELHLHPNPGQIERAQNLVQQYDAIISHHAHCPQPVAAIDQKLVAYSLGNFCSKLWQRNHRHGIVLKMDIGPNEAGKWQTGLVEYGFTHYSLPDKKTVQVGLQNAYKY
jgi:poly-gamma-glutamate capsule biosynthesis protein CapA/YwtB (metallophosphatase superfamily)